MDDNLQPGVLLARGVARHLRSHNFSTILEFVPTSGLRVDVIAIGPKGEIWIIECKSSRADFQSDTKWQGYREWCDQYFWAVSPDFPTDLLPNDTGIFFADRFDAEIIRNAPVLKLSAARRKKLTLKFARNAAERLQALIDPLV
jgi:hypothetical protein